MAVTKDDVLASLARVSCPDGSPLHKSGALSDVLATDGKVFFSITVDAAPLRAGPVSFAVRWHGERPALLWEAPSGTELRTPALDPAWSSTAGSGEVLLAAPSSSLLSMGERAPLLGTSVDAPEQFS